MEIAVLAVVSLIQPNETFLSSSTNSLSEIIFAADNFMTEEKCIKFVAEMDNVPSVRGNTSREAVSCATARWLIGSWWE